TATVAAFSFGTWDVMLASSPTDYTVAGQGGVPGHSLTLANNLNSDATVVRTGPLVGGPYPPSGAPAATWIPWGLTGTFTYDPTLGNDFVIQIDKCGTISMWGTSMDGQSGTAGLNGGNRYGDTAICNAVTTSFSNNEFVPTVRIDYTENNNLQASWGGPAVADFNVTLGMLSPGAVEGFTMLSATTVLPAGQGPIYGLLPDSLTWLGLVQPAAIGNPFHFIVGPGTYPTNPLNLPPGTMAPFVGQTWDLVVLLFDGSFGFVGNSNVVRFSFN
ncbi:MAG: hypothetical protein CMJ83_19720, partial [Planctomycetes bacterium]|nr:hypothetical protein [Planctomycetota bacterium]